MIRRVAARRDFKLQPLSASQARRDTFRHKAVSVTSIVSALHWQVSWNFMGVHPTIEAATLGMWDTMILMILALVVFGPRRLPMIGRQIGKLMYEFRKASNDFRYQMEEELRNAEEADRRQREEAERQRALAATPPAQIEASNEPVRAESEAGSFDPYREPEGPDSYDAAIFDQHPPEAEPEANQLTVQPPASGAPVPAKAPTARASALPAEAAEAGDESRAPEQAPSGDEAAASHPADISAENLASEQARANEAGAETEPAAHHG